MYKVNALLNIIPVFTALFLFGCCSITNPESVEKIPYMAEGRMEMEENSADYEVAGLDFFFMNKSDSDVTEMTLVFFLFDKDGEPVSGGKSNIVMTVKENVPANTSLRCSLCLDKYFSIVPDEVYTVDYFYISKIVYDDGSVWSDPFGMCAFN